MDGNPSRFKGKDLPVETVSWDDCQLFCRQVGERAGQSLRLPTEAEWEYACRAGTSTPFFVGAVLSGAQANYEGKVGKTTALGSFAPNAWGLFDMHGSVWEWCWDWYAPFDTEEVQDPAGPAAGTARVVRGGSWRDRSRDCRAANRGRSAPADRYDYVGFRAAFRLD
jgi:formylglycine-generating enzyme required for sulfatase activity